MISNLPINTVATELGNISGGGLQICQPYGLSPATTRTIWLVFVSIVVAMEFGRLLERVQEHEDCSDR